MTKKKTDTKEDSAVLLDDSLPFDTFLKKHARVDSFLFQEESWRSGEVPKGLAKAYTLPAFIVENLTLMSNDIRIEPGDKSRPVVFRNCTFRPVLNKCTTFVRIAEERKAEFVDCRFEAPHRTCFTVESGADLNLTRSKTESTILVEGMGNSDVRVDDCDIFNFLVMSVYRINFVSRLPYSVDIEQASYVQVSDVDESDPRFESAHPCLSVWNGKDGAFSTVRFYDSALSAKRVVSIRDSVYSVYCLRSHIQVLDIEQSLIRQLYTPDSTIRMLRTADSTLVEPCGKSVENAVRSCAPARSHGFPDLPMVLYKKAVLRIPSRNPFSRKCARSEEVIVKLSVPASARKRYDTSYRKIRVSEAVVTGLYNLKNEELTLPALGRLLGRYEVHSFRDTSFRYWPNKTVKPSLPFDDSDNTCSSGIHGFLDFEDAVNYSIW